MNICILDNFDSFTFNLRDEFCSSHNKIHIWRNNMSVDDAEKKLLALSLPRLLVLSPGPGNPQSAGCMMELLAKVKGQIPVFGVCLGMQAIVEHFGGQIKPASNVVHGKARVIEHDGSAIFSGLDERLSVGRYHSLAATNIPECLQVSARGDDEVMAVSHTSLPIVGVQFHPESILSTKGCAMIENVCTWAKEHS